MEYKRRYNVECINLKYMITLYRLDTGYLLCALLGPKIFGMHIEIIDFFMNMVFFTFELY